MLAILTMGRLGKRERVACCTSYSLRICQADDDDESDAWAADIKQKRLQAASAAKWTN